MIRWKTNVDSARIGYSGECFWYLQYRESGPGNCRIWGRDRSYSYSSVSPFGVTPTNRRRSITSTYSDTVGSKGGQCWPYQIFRCGWIRLQTAAVEKDSISRQSSKLAVTYLYIDLFISTYRLQYQRRTISVVNLA
jgi:hypothetical protein